MLEVSSEMHQDMNPICSGSDCCDHRPHRSPSPAASMSQVSSASYSGTQSEEERFSEVSLRDQAHHALKSLQLHMQFNKHKCGKDSVNGNVLTELLQRPEIKNFLVALSQVSMFDSEDIFNALPSDLAAAGVLRSLRYCFARTPVDLAMDLAELADCNSFIHKNRGQGTRELRQETTTT